MEHSFNIYIAKEYGINCAILLKNIYFWIEKNRANNKYFYDNNYWTYNTKKAFADLFPYINERQIDYALKKLIDDGIIITGNYNENQRDRTLWYAITKKGYCILQNCEMETTKLLNGNNKIVECNNTYINTNNKQDINNNLEYNLKKENIKEKVKNTYGEYDNITLTDDEFNKLKNEFPNEYLESIEYLSCYKVEQNYKTKSDYLTIRRWVIKAIQEKQVKENRFKSKNIKESEDAF